VTYVVYRKSLVQAKIMHIEGMHRPNCLVASPCTAKRKKAKNNISLNFPKDHVNEFASDLLRSSVTELFVVNVNCVNGV